MIDAEKFFLESGSEQLAKIYQWARARYAAPWAVFFAVLLRVTASVGPHVQLPGTIGGRASLNLLCAFVSASGGGKGISDKVGRLAWPTQVLELPIGSGEGIAATFKKPDKEDENTVTAAIFSIPEIDTLAGIAARQGSILLAQLKSMAMGEQLGQSNASKATSRVVEPHSYRCCLSIGAQPGHTGVLFNDTTGGTPQRLLWSPTTDPDMPAEPSPDPAPLNTTLPRWTRGQDGVAEVTYGIPEIAETVIAAHIARQRGQANPLDGHRMLTRCKVAALLAIMHQRSVVSQWDWDRSADVMAVSDHTREWIVSEAQRAARATIHDRAMARARGEEFVSEHKLQRAKSAVIRWLGRDTELAANQLRSKLKADLRDHFGAAIAELAADRLVIEIQVDRGARYRLNPEVQGVPPVQGAYEQLSEGVLDVQGVPGATVTDLDSHRSGSVKLSCRQVLETHIAERLAAGSRTTDLFAVAAFGEKHEHLRQSMIAEASKHPGMIIMSRREGNTVWWIDPTREPPQRWQPVSKWIDSYLRRLGNGVDIDRDELQAQGFAEGYSWENLRKAVRSHPDVVTDSAGPNTTWSIRRTDGQSA